jgi:hypothetical protein
LLVGGGKPGSKARGTVVVTLRPGLDCESRLLSHGRDKVRARALTITFVHLENSHLRGNQPCMCPGLCRAASTVREVAAGTAEARSLRLRPHGFHEEGGLSVLRRAAAEFYTELSLNPSGEHC